MDTHVHKHGNARLEVSTSGGETFIDGWDSREYGIEIGSLSVDGLHPDVVKKLAAKLVNHLAINGHGYHIVATGHQDQPTEFEWK